MITKFCIMNIDKPGLFHGTNKESLEDIIKDGYVKSVSWWAKDIKHAAEEGLNGIKNRVSQKSNFIRSVKVLNELITNLRILKIKLNSVSYNNLEIQGTTDKELQDYPERDYLKLYIIVPYKDLEVINITNEIREYLFDKNGV